MTKNTTRRDFLKRGGGAAGASLLALNLPFILATAEAAAAAESAAEPLNALEEAEARTVAAVADQIFPPDDQPGASDIGAVYFIDGALGGFMAGTLPMIRSGCTELDEASRESAGAVFADLPFDEQTKLLQERQDSPFFGVLHFLTLAGIFSAPKYGGNRDRIGWQLLGFEPRHAWQPPFGYYDADYRREHHDADA